MTMTKSAPPTARKAKQPARAANPELREKTNLPEHLPYQLVHVSALLSLGVSRLFQARFGLGIREWRVLAILGFYGPSSAADLVGRVAFDKSTISRAIKRLEQDGYIARGPHPSDARRQLIFLTEKGADMHDRIAPVSRMRRRIIESALTEAERRQLGQMLEKLRVQLEWLNREEETDILAAMSERE